MEGRRGLWIAVIVLAVVLVGMVGSCCIFGGWLIAEAPQDDLDAETATREGARDGASGTTDACIRAGYERTRPCSSLQTTCIGHARSYLLACLREVPEPSTELCLGAPADPGLLPEPTFTRTLCGRYGWAEDDVGCGDVASVVETHCASNAVE